MPLTRPQYVPDDNWSAIRSEDDRFRDALSHADHSAVIGALKSLVESVARVTLDLAGQPAATGTDFTSTLNKAHNLLRNQPGDGLTNDSPFSAMGDQAKKLASNLASIRNDFGTGHGRSRPPAIEDEMVALSIDGALVWVRWALRRLGPFTAGRPEPLIHDLGNETFRSGLLAERLRAANIPSLEKQSQRALGTAVGQRVMQGTFVVRIDGLEPCIQAGSLDPWTTEYRRGLATGLVKDENGKWTITAQSLRWAVDVLAPVPDNTTWLSEWVDEIVTGYAGPVANDHTTSDNIHQYVQKAARDFRRQAGEPSPLERLAEHIEPTYF